MTFGPSKVDFAQYFVKVRAGVPFKIKVSYVSTFKSAIQFDCPDRWTLSPKSLDVAPGRDSVWVEFTLKGPRHPQIELIGKLDGATDRCFLEVLE